MLIGQVPLPLGSSQPVPYDIRSPALTSHIVRTGSERDVSPLDQCMYSRNNGE